MRSKILEWSFRRETFFLVFAASASILFRLFLIYARKYPTGDEIWAFFLAKANFHDIWFATLSDLHPPFYFFMLHGFDNLLHLNPGVLAYRFISLFFAILANLAIWYLATLMYGNKTGRIAFYLSLFLPAFVWSSILARYYSLLILLTTLALIVFVNFLKKREAKYLLLLTLISIIGIYTHYYFFLLDVSLGFFLLIQKKYQTLIKKWVVSMLFTTLFVSPALFYLITLPKPELGGRHTNDVLKLPAIIITNISSWEVLLYTYYNVNFIFASFFAAAVLLIMLMLIVKTWPSLKNGLGFLLLSATLVPPILAIIFAYTVQPLLALGSLVIFLPAFLIILANILREGLKRAKIVSYIFIITIFFILILLYKSSVSYSKPQNDFKFIKDKLKAGDLVIHSHIYSFIIAKYYLGENVNYGIAPAFSATFLSEKALGYKTIPIESVLSHQGRIWWVDPPYDLRPEVVKFRKNLFENLELLMAEKAVTPGFQENDFDIYLYKKKM